MDERKTMRVVYVGWVGFGNLGDDVCRDLFTAHLRRALAAKGRDLEVRWATYQGVSEQYLLEYRPHLVVLGGGSLFTLQYLQPIILAQKHGIPTAVWGTGFDKLSARQLDDLLEGGNGMSGSPRHSVWQDEGTARTFREAVDSCRWAGVRGPHTQRILRAAGCLSPPLHISGDPGLLLRPAAIPEPLPAFLKEWIDAEEPIVGINWGTANNQVFGRDEKRVEEALKQVIGELVRRSYKVLLFAVWGPDLGAVRRLASAFSGTDHASRAGDAAGGSPSNLPVSALAKVPSGPLLAWILKHCRFTINFKLHANVFTAAVGRPFVALGYRSKCYDFAASLRCEDQVVRFDEPDLTDAILDVCDTVERDAKKIIRRIDKHRRTYGRRLKALINQMAALPGDEVRADCVF